VRMPASSSAALPLVIPTDRPTDLIIPACVRIGRRAPRGGSLKRCEAAVDGGAASSPC
jgi:hypothetical protein